MGREKRQERGLTSFSLYASHRTQRALVFLPPQPPDYTKGSFSKDDGDDSENVTFKMNKCFFKLCRVYSNSMKMLNVGKFPLELISWGPHSSLERERNFGRRLLSSSIKRETGHFHVVVVQ